MCRMLGVSRSGYYDWRGRPPSTRTTANLALLGDVRRLQARHHGRYGSPRMGEMLDGDEPVLGPRIHRLVSDMRLRWTALDERIAALDAEFTDAARADERTRRLLTIPGIGALNATALVAAVGACALQQYAHRREVRQLGARADHAAPPSPCR